MSGVKGERPVSVWRVICILTPWSHQQADSFKRTAGAGHVAQAGSQGRTWGRGVRRRAGQSALAHEGGAGAGRKPSAAH